MRYLVKITLLILFVLVAADYSAFAQEQSQQKTDIDSLKFRKYDYIAYQKSEIYIQYGAPSIMELTGKPEKIVSAGSNGSESKGDNFKYRYTGIAALGYNFYINPYVGIGAYFGVGEAQRSGSYSNRIRSYTGLLGASWTYYREGIWEVSSGVWLGLSYKDEHIFDVKIADKPKEKDQMLIAYNLTACRVRVGSGTIGGFAELGFGYKGVASIGLSVKF